jgi:hypothetical protein
VADGCGRTSEDDRLKLRSPQWVYVGDREAPAAGPPPAARWAHGVVGSGTQPFLAAHPAGNDLPTAHLSYDVVFNVRPDPTSAPLLAGDPAARTGNYEGREDKTGRLHAEWEEGALPRFAWPADGDRVSVLGSWVWDCDHWDPGGERTELHPPRVVWVLRRGGRPSPASPYGESEADLVVSTDKTPAGSQADCAHRAKGDVAVFQACLASAPLVQDVTGRYRFFLPAPPKPGPGARLRVRVLDAGSSRGAPQLRLTRRANGVAVALDVAPSLGPGLRRLVVAKRVLAGWTPTPAGALPVHLRVRLERLLVRRAMDPGCPTIQPDCPASKQSTRLGTASARPGEWNVYWNVGGRWGAWAPALLRTTDGRAYRGRQVVDLYLLRGARWQLLVFARECDLGFLGNARGTRFPLAPCPANGEAGRNDDPGVIAVTHRSAAASVGLRHADSRLAGSTCPRVNRRGCYRLTYRVTLVEDAAARAADLARGLPRRG